MASPSKPVSINMEEIRLEEQVHSASILSQLTLFISIPHSNPILSLIRFTKKANFD